MKKANNNTKLTAPINKIPKFKINQILPQRQNLNKAENKKIIKTHR